MKSALRDLALVAGGLYFAVALFVVLLVAGEGNNNLGATLALVAIPAGAAATFVAAAWREPGRHTRAIEVATWFTMVGGSVVLISFSFVLWPALLLALPHLLIPSESGCG